MDKKVVVTGCSGFIGFHLSNSLLETDIQVIGIDSLNSAYDVKLKQKRLEKLDKYNNFTFFNNNLSQEDSLENIQMPMLKISVLLFPSKIIHIPLSMKFPLPR